ncbi:Sperm flagellar protein 2, partial [Rhizoclosmatium hyalinum]
MSVILAQWLQNDVGLSRRVSPTDLDSAFASGFLFAEVLFRLNKVSPADFAAFENCNALNLEAAVANFSKIELVLRESLNVKLSPNTAFDLISGKKGGAARLLYQIKAASGNAPSQKDKEIIALPPLPHLRDNKPAFESYPTSPLPGSPHPPLSANVTSSPRRKYDEKEHDFFAETLRLKLRRVHHAGYRPLDHPRLDHPEVDYEKLLERKRREQQEKLDLLERENEKKPPKVAEACEPVSQTKKALPPRKVIKELTKTEHAYSMREQAKLDKKREAIELRDKRIVQNLLQNLDQFEKNLHMDEKPKDEETVVEAKEEETAALDPEDIKAFVSKRASLDPIQHSKELSRQMPPQEEEAKKTEEYVDKIRERKLEEDVSRKEREQRRRKIVLGHQQAKEEMEKSHLEELLLTKLMRQSKQERRIAEGLMQIRLEKDFMCENRMHREEQYAKRRQKDYEEALEREFILAEKAREEYKKQT